MLSITRDDFSWDYFRAGGKGGQGQNKRSTGVRCTHPPSGAVGEGRDERSQTQNRRNAFLRCVQSPEFQRWLRHQTSRRVASLAELEAEIAREVERQMAPANLLVEEWDGSGWVTGTV